VIGFTLVRAALAPPFGLEWDLATPDDDAPAEVVHDAHAQDVRDLFRGRERDAGGCPIWLTDEVCRDAAFWQTSCGARELEKASSTCHDAFVDYLNGSATLPYVPLVDSRTGEITEVFFEDYDPTRITWEGFDTFYAPHLLALTHPTPERPRVDAEEDLAWWEANCSVQSCEEYAFEAFEDYSRFEVLVAPALGRADWRAVYEAARSAQGISSRTLRSRTGRILPDVTLALDRSVYLEEFVDGYRGPLYNFSVPAAIRGGPEPGFVVATDNVGLRDPGDPIHLVPYLLAMLGELPASVPDLPGTIVDLAARGDLATHCSWRYDDGAPRCLPGASDASRDMTEALAPHVRQYDSAWESRIPDEPSDFDWPHDHGIEGWAFHAQLSDSLSHVPDERLYWLEDRQDELGALERRRRVRWRRLGDLVRGCWASGSRSACLEDRDEVRGVLDELGEIDERIEGLLVAFDVAGCLTSFPTPCDWSPRWPAMEVMNRFRSEREGLYATCIAKTGNDFSSLRHDPDDEAVYWLRDQDATLGGICRYAEQD